MAEGANGHGGAAALGGALDAAIAGEREAAPWADEVHEAGDLGGGGEDWGGPGTGLPEQCPVRALGVQGDVLHFLDPLGQYRAIKAKDMSRLTILGLFGKCAIALQDFWPRVGAKGAVLGWDQGEASEALIAGCHNAGVWEPADKIRGRGGWAGPDGELIFHCGDRLYVCDQSQATGYLRAAGTAGGLIYPTAPPIPRPSPAPVAGGEGGPAWALLQRLQSWSWRRGETDAYLLLGWIGAGFLGGAADFHPVVWMTGDKGTGKTTLQKLLAGIAGGAMLSVSDTSAAGIWQTLGLSTLPVAVDELEPDAGDRHGSAVIKLARLAASGSLLLRGGDQHTSTKFQARSCFAFSSILVPPLTAADRSRIAMLELDPLTGTVPPGADARALAELGRQLRRRLADGWWRWPDTLEAYRATLARAGHSARGADVFGTLLAAADLLLWDVVPSDDDLAAWGERLAASALSETDDDVSDHWRCLQHLLSSPLDLWRKGERKVVADWLCLARGRDPTNAVIGDEVAAAKSLEQVGLKLVSLPPDPRAGPDDRGGEFLAVANSHQGVAAIFRETHWQGRAGGVGVWVQALRRVPGSRRSGSNLRFAGVPCRATLVPMSAIEGEGEAG